MLTECFISRCEVGFPRELVIMDDAVTLSGGKRAGKRRELWTDGILSEHAFEL